MPDLHQALLIHADDVWRIAIQLVSDENDARDCYQQTFADALRIPAQNVEDWGNLLRRIATRRAMDLLRRRYRDRKIQEIGLVEPATRGSPDDPLQFDELRQSVRQILAQLPALQAEAFYLRHLEQMDPAEIAAELGIETNHVRVLVHRALDRLRKALPSSLQPVETGGFNGEKDCDK